MPASQKKSPPGQEVADGPAKVAIVLKKSSRAIAEAVKSPMIQKIVSDGSGKVYTLDLSILYL